MFIELIATIFAGIACAGIAMVLNILSGRRFPKWVMPIAAGSGMLAMTITNEYTWYDRTAQELPEGIVVTETVQERGWLRPWTQVWPYTKRFAAVDVANARTNAAVPDQHLLDLYFFGRWSPVDRAPVVIDCAQSRSALLVDGAEFDDVGRIVDAQWQVMEAGDPMLGIVCGS